MTNKVNDSALEEGEFPPDTPSRAVLLVDELPLRREAYTSLLSRWAEERHLTLRPEGFDTYKAQTRDAALLILNGGSTSIAELRLRSELVDINLRDTPLVIISDRDEVEQVTEAIALGARGFLPSTLSPDLALKTLTFILGGGDFFPPSALKSFDPRRRRELLD